MFIILNSIPYWKQTYMYIYLAKKIFETYKNLTLIILDF